MLRKSLTTSSLLSTLQDCNLRGISTPSEKVAWASGSNGTFLRTIDCGTFWEVGRIPNCEKLEFRDIKAFDADTAYIMSSGSSEDSRIYKTTDGGKSWQLQLKCKQSEEFFNCMAFWNRDHGMVLSDPVDGKFKIYITKDGGLTWSPSPTSGMPNALEGEGAFAASGSCMITQGEQDVWFGTGANTARVFHSGDGGNHWEVTNTPIMQDSASSGIFSIAFYDLKNGVIAGGDYNHPEKGGANLAFTKDGGETWNLATLSPQYYCSAVAYSKDSKHILTVGSNHAGLLQSNVNQSWKELSDVQHLNALSFWSKSKAIAVGMKGMIQEFEIPKLQ